jgi:hypothetical protein
MAEVLATGTRTYLDTNDSMDVLMWGKEEDEDGTLHKSITYPTTRYDAVLNRPRVLSTIDGSPAGPFHLVAVSVEEVDDDEVFAMYKQMW